MKLLYESGHSEDQKDGRLSDGQESVDAHLNGRDEIAGANASKQPSGEEKSGGKLDGGSEEAFKALSDSRSGKSRSFD